jgi:3-phenylpropionate/cinnamic acid dioxygenase small subunit
MNDAVHIANLLYRYAELIDSGDLAGTAALFERARVRMAGDTVIEGAAGMLAVWHAHVRIYPCGTPRTKHVVTNPIIEVDEAAGTATARSYYTVLQATPDLPLQVICAGRYHDEFAKDSMSGDWGGWHFTARDYSMLDMMGNMSAHMLVEVGAGG